MIQLCFCDAEESILDHDANVDEEGCWDEMRSRIFVDIQYQQEMSSSTKMLELFSER
jgi:hypothetical protein